MSETPDLAARFEPLRVLVIDDNPDDRELTIRELRRAFPRLAPSEIADQPALEAALEAGAFDAVVTDYQLRWSDGLTVLRAVKGRDPDRPVVMFTNTADQETAVEAMKEGLDDYVIKSAAHFVRLSAAVRSALARAEARRQAQVALAVRDDFLIIAAHELRTPLTVITASVQGALARLRQMGEPAQPSEAGAGQGGGQAQERQDLLASVQAALRRANRQAKRLDHLVDEINEAALLQQEALSVHPTQMDVLEAARDAVEDQRLLWPERVITLDAPDADLPGALDALGDPERVYQVMTNYLTNALKFSPPDQPVEARILATDDAVRVEVSDHGAGIPPEQQARVWERFYRAPDIGRRSGSSVGLGLGLYVSRMLIGALGGETGVESQPSQGATFWFTLPRA